MTGYPGPPAGTRVLSESTDGARFVPDDDDEGARGPRPSNPRRGSHSHGSLRLFGASGAGPSSSTHPAATVPRYLVCIHAVTVLVAALAAANPGSVTIFLAQMTR
eukprot:368023-Rhodomonas_salina.3